MSTVNDYTLNPDCRSPLIAGKKLTDRWYVYFFYYENGARKPYRISKGINEPGQTLSERRRKANEIRADLDDKLKTIKFNTALKAFEKSVSETLVINDLVDEYLSSIKVAKQTLANYSSIFKFFKIHFNNLTVADATKDLLQDFIRNMDVKPQSKRSYRTYLATFFNWLIEERRISINKNPVHGIKLPNNLPTERHRVYSKSDMDKIVKYCDERNDLVLKTIIYLVYGAQVRISEILKIQMQDFNLEQNKIVLPKGKGKVKNKGKIILLDDPLKQYLLSLPLDYFSIPQDYYFIGIARPFAKSKFGMPIPLSKNTIDTRFKLLKKELNIEAHKTLYSFKHTGNVNLLINGADLIELMYKNGHTKISQTETYARQLIEQVPEMKYIRKTREDCTDPLLVGQDW